MPARKLPAEARVSGLGPPLPTIPAVATQLTTGADWLAANPPRRVTTSLAVVAERARSGEGFQHAVRDFLDEFALHADQHSRAQAIAERPAPSADRRHDAYLGALAEHLAALYRLDRPAWSVQPDRFLDSFWFVSDVAGFRAIAIAQAPAAFRRRGVFIPERSLHRV